MMRVRALALAALAGVAFSTAGHAQNQQLSQSSRVLQTVSVADISRLLGAAGITVTQTEASEQGIALEARLSAEAAFFIMMRGCDASGAGCELVQPFILFDTAGVNFAQVNDYNLNQSALSMAMLSPAGYGVLGFRVYPEGGITEANLINNFGIFLDDINRFVSSVYPSATASLDAPAEAEVTATAVSLAGDSTSFIVPKHAKPMKLGKDAPSFAFDPAEKIEKH